MYRYVYMYEWIGECARDLLTLLTVSKVPNGKIKYFKSNLNLIYTRETLQSSAQFVLYDCELTSK